MVDDLELGAHVGVLVEEGVEAVGAVGDDRLPLVVDAGLVEEFDQALGEDLVEVFVAEATGRVAVAGFHAFDHAEGDVGLTQERDDGAGDLLGAVDEGSGAADEVEVVLLAGPLGHLILDALHPGFACVGGAAPGVALAFERLQGALDGVGHAGILHDEGAAHVDDRGDVLDEDGAGLDAGAAGAAGPKRLVADHAADHWGLVVEAEVEVVALDEVGDFLLADGGGVGLEVLDDVHGREGWPAMSAGQLSVQRPQRTQTSSSKSCFIEKCSSWETPKCSCSSMFSIMSSLPGADVRLRKALAGARMRWLSLE